MEVKDMICIVCPLGCRLKVSGSEAGQGAYVVKGNKCFRGEDYGIKEMTNPTRVLTTTVIITGATVKRLPVRTSGAIPKKLLRQAMDLINKVEVKAPVKSGQIIIDNILGTGIDIIASRSIYRELYDLRRIYVL